MEISALPKDKKIILFDGVCNLCNALVQFIVKRDKKDVFRFVPLQSELGQKISNYIEINTKDLDSIILYEPEQSYYYKAQAILKITNELGGLYNLFRIATIFPKPFLNFIYNYIAKNRYKWYGKKEECMIPTLEIRAKFLA